MANMEGRMRVNPGETYGRRGITSLFFIRIFATLLMTVFLFSMLVPGMQVHAVSENEIAADGEYYGTITATKRKDNDTYYATLYVGVEDGVISYVSIEAYEKQDKFYEYAYPQAMQYVGQPASLSSIPDAVSSASTSSGSSKYTMNVADAMRQALSQAPARENDDEDDDDDSGDSDEDPDGHQTQPASEGSYTGTSEMSNGHRITLNVTVDSEGKISDISIKEADGNWDSLLGEVKGNYIGTYADLSADDGNEIDAVTSATEKGYRSAIADAIKNALNNGPNQNGSDDTGKTDDGSNTGSTEDGSDTGKTDDGSNTGSTEDGSDTGKTDGGSGAGDPEPAEEDVVYESGTTETVSGRTFTGKVTVKSGAAISFENCWFPSGIEIEDSGAVAIVSNSYFGTESFYIPVQSNVLNSVDEKSEVTKESGLSAAFPDFTYDKNNSGSTTNAVFKSSDIENVPGWATAEEIEHNLASGTYHGYYLTGTAPEVEEDTKQSFGVRLHYADEEQGTNLDVSIPVVLTIAQTEDTSDKEDQKTDSKNGETIVDPGTGGVETDKDDSFELSKGVNVTNVLPGNTFTLTLEANATGTTTTETKTGAANILLVLDNTTSMNTAYGSNTRLAAMKEAAKSFVSGLPESEESQIAMMSFVIGDRTSPTTIDIGWTALNEDAKNTVTSSINALSAPDQNYGFDTSYVTPLNAASGYVDSTGNGNPTYVVFFSDGDDINPQADLESAANTLKNKTKATFSIGIVQARYFYDDETVFRAKAKAIASQEDYYYEPATAADLTAAFNQSLQVIQSEISTSKTTVGSEGVFKDVVNTDKFDVSGATASVTVYDYESGDWVPLENAVASAQAGGSGTLESWANKSDEDGTLEVSLDTDGTVTITGFSYKDHYLPSNDEEAEGVHAQRLHLEISGIKLKDGAQQTTDQTGVPTNDDSQSGIFKDSAASSAVKYFPLPKVNIPGKGGVSKSTENVQNVTVKKEWSGEAGDSVEVELLEDGEVKDTQTLNEANDWTYIWEDLDEGKTYAVAEKSAQKDGEDVSAEYKVSISDPVVEEKSETVREWAKKDYLTPENIVDGGTYIFSYEYYNTTYLLGATTNMNASSVAGVGTIVENGELTTFPENAQWIVTKSGDGYLLRNVYRNLYLVMSRYGNLSLGETGTVFDIDDGDGSIYSGSYNIRCTSYPSTSSYSFTAFIPYEFTDKTVNTTSAVYTITNTKKAVIPVIDTGINALNQMPLIYLVLCAAASASLLGALHLIIRKISGR